MPSHCRHSGRSARLWGLGVSAVIEARVRKGFAAADDLIGSMDVMSYPELAKAHRTGKWGGKDWNPKKYAAMIAGMASR